ncbi:unnamed protein product [Rotaria magnacalcarata]|uniref:Uncharacterized protein n=2 Tax=Rotaria magnacalcarata TaxID=392030 RepID=A0A816KGH7_9BILA|nr:unnamed protein product [Rotaria magnacalcarata]CAF1251888.1 unnamed protein product [Rotaria magnacalcarata]CAF1904932.1 unnamed protein product [Rotaria magnacalcarata]CAF1931546.1 unnamed protein product [Rotaria magnacalcarata]CAF2100134.1 unnamed protein product [Rotaria magnacalcarata]
MATNAFQPAVGGTSRGEANLSGMSKQYSARDMPANKTLKYREKGQHTQEELRLKDREGMRRELEERERNIRDKQRSSSDTKRITSGGTTSSRSKPAITHTETNIDADDPLDESSSDEETTSHQTKFNKNTQSRAINNEEGDDDDEDDDEDEDDTAELMAELGRIKKERAAEAARLEQQKRLEEERIRTENILKGNPLLNPGSKPSAPITNSEFRVKRRWDDDVVFKNCAKADGSSGEKRVAQFINDSLRSEFHRRFMDKYIK